MSERNLDFESVTNRYGTKSLKYDFKEERHLPDDVLPLWVADMDYRTSSYIEDALVEQAKHAIFGYTEVDDDFLEALKNYIARHYNRVIEKEWFHKSPSVVFSIATAVKAFTEEGGYVLINQPVYYPFMGTIKENNRKIISSDLVNDGTGYYRIDFKDLEEKIKEYRPKLYLLCSPHNPVGRVWSKKELHKIGELCKKYGIIVFSDEIHSDFVWGREFTTFTNAGEDFDRFCITSVSPSKTFNLAGLQVSGIITSNQEIYNRFHAEYSAAGFSQINGMGIIACQAAYTYGEEWLEGVKKAIESNLDYAIEYLSENLPEVKVRKPEGTYLLWLDFNYYDFTDRELNDIIVHDAKLWLDRGNIFGRVGSGFQRINVACPRKTLEDALERLVNTFKICEQKRKIS